MWTQTERGRVREEGVHKAYFPITNLGEWADGGSSNQLEPKS